MRAWALAVLVTLPVAVALTPDPTTLLPPLCLKLGDYTAVWEVQGDSSASPLKGQSVEEVRGIVTFNASRAGGFYVQAHEPDCDDATSDGVFVYTGSTTTRGVEAGDLVAVKDALVIEYFDLTELSCGSGCTVESLARGRALPAARPVGDLHDKDGAPDAEALEGMLVTLGASAIVYGATDAYEQAFVGREGPWPRPHAAARVAPVVGVSGKALSCGLPNARSLDRFEGDLTGPMTYTYGAYYVHLTSCVTLVPGDISSYDPLLHPAPTSGIRVATLNAQRFFDTTNDPRKIDDVASNATFTSKSRKLARVICEPVGLATPDIVALQEIENEVVLEKLAAAVASRCGVTYAWRSAAAPDDSSIENGYLVRSDRVVVESATLLQSCGARDRRVDYETGDAPPGVVCDGETPYYVHPRPPLELVATVAGQRFVLYAVHFKSRLPSSSCTEKDCGDWREDEAAHVAELVRARLASDPQATVIVLGDLNDNLTSDANAPLLEAGLVDLWANMSAIGKVERYSYVYRGVAEDLDHILVGGALRDAPREFSPRHINADHPGSLARTVGPYRASDHDPLVVAFT